jgi:hypothetical protein
MPSYLCFIPYFRIKLVQGQNYRGYGGGVTPPVSSGILSGSDWKVIVVRKIIYENINEKCYKLRYIISNVS